MATAVASQMSDEVVDLTKAPIEEPAEMEPMIVGEEDSTVVIRINADLEDVTVGAGNHYSFKEGQQYRVPVLVARHLEEKGYVWH